MRLHDAFPPPAVQLPSDLTPEEERVLPFICAGWSDFRIALDLGVSDEWVHRHVASCLRKFGATSRAWLAARLLAVEADS